MNVVLKRSLDFGCGLFFVVLTDKVIQTVVTMGPGGPGGGPGGPGGGWGPLPGGPGGGPGFGPGPFGCFAGICDLVGSW